MFILVESVHCSLYLVSVTRTTTCWWCRYLVESIRKFPDAETFAEQVQSAGFRFVEFGRLTGGVVAIHSGFKL